jgi:hypothetical protein
MHAALSPILLGTAGGGGVGALAKMGGGGGGGGRPWPMVALPVLGVVAGLGTYYFSLCGNYDASTMFWEVLRLV